MPQKCQVCIHRKSRTINRLLVVDKASNRSIAKQFSVDHNAVQRHREHVPEKLAASQRAQEVADAEILLDDIATIREKTFKALDSAEGSEDWNTLLRAIREARENVRILGELHGRLGAKPETRPLISQVAMNVIVQVLAPHPELAHAVADALEPLEELEKPEEPE